MGKAKSSARAGYHVTDLVGYPEAVKAFDEFLKRNAGSKASVERLIKEFDDEQRQLWKNLES